MISSESVGMDDEWRMIPEFLSEFIKIDDVFLRSLPFNVARGEGRNAKGCWSHQWIRGSTASEASVVIARLPVYDFYVCMYVEIRIAEVGGFVENRKFRDHRM